MPIISIYPSIDLPESIHTIFSRSLSSIKSQAISPDETALSYAYVPLAQSKSMEERWSWGGVRWRACVGMLAASAEVVVVVANALAGSSRVERVVHGDVVTDMPRLAEMARSLDRYTGLSEKADRKSVV